MANFWIIVSEAATDEPKCFVLTPEEVKDRHHEGNKDGRVSYWLQPKAYAVEQFAEAWSRIGEGG